MKMLRLGTELSKNEQKKVKGSGATCRSSSGNYYTTYNSTVNCSNAAAYCAGVWQGSVVSCWS